MITKGDQMLDVSIPEIGSKGVFTADLENALAAGDIDLAVHSAKDMPSELPDGFEIIAYTIREQAHDVLVSYHEHFELNSNMVIGTSSTRRVALLKHYYPGISTVSVRGNLQTRLRKLEQGGMDALALAYAGICRMGLVDLIKHSLAIDRFIPAVGQGSMAIEVSNEIAADKKSYIRARLNHINSENCLNAERAYLYTIQGGCSIPAFANARLDGEVIKIAGGVVSLDGKQKVQHQVEGPVEQSHQIGQRLAQMVLLGGGDKILDEIKSI